MTTEAIDLYAALDEFSEVFSPRIVTRMNDYDVRIAKIAGEFVWHSHAETDELFLVLDGELTIGLREESGERAVHLRRGSLFVVPRGTEHKPSSVHDASVLLLDPTGTANVGDRHDALPAHITATTGTPV
ncbi:cupin domain-containing protein [Sciscionella sediminilitoris]|uniref:cupin domain-containing protein n=1 Tax=Sciscionella sediminilitoris TaxID=1445613 RepID=UPI0004DF0616|nr:cupin domain-containing protein [Sciscionella sp. SE31]